MSPTWWFGFCRCDCAMLYSDAFPIHCQPCSASCAITDHMNIVSALAALQDTRPTLTTHSYMSSHSSHTLSSMNHSNRHRHAHDATRCWLLPNTRLCRRCLGASARHHLHRKLSQKLTNGDAVALLLYRRRHSRLRGATAFEHAVGSGPGRHRRCKRRREYVN